MLTHSGTLNCSSPTTISADNWRDCVVKCGKNHSCMAAQTGSSITCQLCPFGHVSSFQTINSTAKIALKTNSTVNQTCANFKSGTTFTESYSQNLTTFQYTAKWTVAGWIVTFKTIRKCASGWKHFNRTLGEWCIRVSVTDSYLNRTDAVRKCTRDGAVLSGLETIIERDWVHNTALPLMTDLNDGVWQVQIWLDGIRRSECAPIADRVFPAGCDGTASFRFSDKTLSTKDGYTWSDGNPDGLRYDSNTVQNCIVMWIKPNAALADDNFCTASTNNYGATGFGIRGYACGKPAG
ncbi:unnamed protein product [Caenorhabditis sp. 36 PRJEB53466]|nr:unnamed protein product [Caenorhabditis sp. 36 PRJEB53466]